MKTEPPEKSWDMFFEVATKAGLEPKCCHVTHWQIKGGTRNKLVNCWPNTKKGFRFQAEGGEFVFGGNVSDAIQMAGVKRPAADSSQGGGSAEKPVGLCRTVWRLFWKWIW